MGAYSPVRLRLKSAIGNQYYPDFALCSRRGCTENVPRLTRDYLTQFGLVDADTLMQTPQPDIGCDQLRVPRKPSPS